MSSVFNDIELLRRRRNRVRYNRIDKIVVPSVPKVRGTTPRISVYQSMRRAMTKISFHSKWNPKHLEYLLREGAGGKLFSEEGEKNIPQHAIHKKNHYGEKRVFRLIISPEGGEYMNLKSFTKDFMKRVAEDIDVDLSWAAVTHNNTQNPHVHVIIRGIDKKGKEVYFPKHYVKEGLRTRAKEITTERLGLRSAWELLAEQNKQVDLEAFTPLDRILERRMSLGKIEKIRTSAILRKRISVLLTMGLVRETKKSFYFLNGWKENLRAMARRNSIVHLRSKIVHEFPNDKVQVLKPEEIVQGKVERIIKNNTFDVVENLVVRTGKNSVAIISAKGRGRVKVGDEILQSREKGNEFSR